MKWPCANGYVPSFRCLNFSIPFQGSMRKDVFWCSIRDVLSYKQTLYNLKVRNFDYSSFSFAPCNSELNTSVLHISLLDNTVRMWSEKST